MGQLLQADIDALRTMAKGVRDEAGKIEALNPTEAIAKVVESMPNSAIGFAAAAAAAPILAAYKRLAGELRTMADASDTSATSYETLDQTYKAQMDKYLQGQP